ncbi:hypothetical protein FQN60_004525, partial [Etheostoma spectabile]
MSYANQSVTNVSAEQQYQGLLERLIFSTVTTVPCCVFLFLNGTMLFTLRSKTVFCETSRYILLFNLLFADTVQMSLSQLLYILAAVGLRLTYPLCGVLTMLSDLTNEISPLTLVVMSVERYVAVCYPLRHSTLVTIRNTVVAIVGVWVFSSLNVLTKVILLLDFPFKDLESLQMRDYCSGIAMFLGPMSDSYNKAYTCVLFVSAGVAVTSSYIGVTIAARSASTDKASARRAPLYRVAARIVFVRAQNVLYVLMCILPRCLSSLIYGIRDQTIRPVLMDQLCCR